MIEQAEFLKYDTNTAAQIRQFGARQGGNIAPEHGDEAARRALGHEHEFEQRGFASA